MQSEHESRIQDPHVEQAVFGELNGPEQAAIDDAMMSSSLSAQEERPSLVLAFCFFCGRPIPTKKGIARLPKGFSAEESQEVSLGDEQRWVV